MPDFPLKVKTIQYSELGSKEYRNVRFGLECETTPETYDHDRQRLIIEVKSRLNEILSDIKPPEKSRRKKK